jgi:hypothetical protein
METMVICPHCGGNACYEQQINEEVTTHFCFGCGFTTSTLMQADSKLVKETLENSPELYKDLLYTDDSGKSMASSHNYSSRKRNGILRRYIER